jgi:LuxR family transcriptional regulator, maltose regulon positive regulatory protein
VRGASAPAASRINKDATLDRQGDLIGDIKRDSRCPSPAGPAPVCGLQRRLAAYDPAVSDALAEPRSLNTRFATTKIQPPRLRAQRIERPTLAAALLVATRQHRVVLLQAPAGFGKTSALAALATQVGAGRDPSAPGSALAWVSLDADDDAARLLSCLAAALEPYDLPWRTLPEALVAQMHQGPAAVSRAVDELLNALAHADVGHGVIVMEDLHRVRSTDLVAFGDHLIKRLPATWCLVLTCRETPPLALARLRAAGELAEFGPEALRFSADESAAFVAAVGLGLGATAAQSLHERTQGWPAGLRLATLAGQAQPVANAASPQGNSAPPSRALGDRYLFDYLAAEVLDALPAELHDFLLRCSVLPELTADRAAAVSGDRHAALRLDEIERRALFVTPLDAGERTLVLHDLFRDALRAHMARRLPGELPRLLHRAAVGETDPVRRVGYLLQASDWAGAEEALDDAAPTIFLHNGPGDVERLLTQFDAGWRDRSVVLQALQVGAALLRWDWDAVVRHGQQVQAMPEPHEGETPRCRAARERTLAVLAMALYVADRNEASEALIARLRATSLVPSARRLLLISDATQHFRRGQHNEVQHLYREVLDSLEAGASLYEWWECVPAANWSTLPGMQRQMQRYVDGATLQLRGEPLALRADILMLQAYGHLWGGRVAAAREAAQAAEDDQRWLACSGETDITVQMFRLIEGAISGRADETRQRLEALRERNLDATPERRRLWQHHLAVYGVRISHLLGDGPEVLERWAAWLKEDPLRRSDHRNGRAVAVRFRHAAALGHWAEAVRQFEQLEPLLATMDVHAHALELRVRGAHAQMQAGAIEAATRLLQPALQRMRDEASPGYALMAGPVVLQALHDGLGSALPLELAQTLSAAVALAASARQDIGVAGGPFPPHAAPVPVLPPPPEASSDGTTAAGARPWPTTDGQGTPAMSLSARETEVLALMSRGQSNKAIARTLDISPHTVKRHVANILDKLVLQSRGEAAAWWLRR